MAQSLAKPTPHEVQATSDLLNGLINTWQQYLADAADYPVHLKPLPKGHEVALHYLLAMGLNATEDPDDVHFVAEDVTLFKHAMPEHLKMAAKYFVQECNKWADAS